MMSFSARIALGSAAVVLALAPAPVLAQNALHPVLQQAIANSDRAAREEDWRFTLRVSSADGELVGRFDGSLAEGERWQLISPAEDALTSTQSDLWNGFVEDEGDESGDDDGEDNGLFFSFSDADIAPGSLSLAEQTAESWVFEFEPALDDEDMDLTGYLRGQLIVGGDPVVVRQVRLWAPESFKPHFAVRLNTFEMVQAYEPVHGIPAPVLTRLSQSLAGSAAFQSFDQSFELAFSEVEYLGADAPAR